MWIMKRGGYFLLELERTHDVCLGYESQLVFHVANFQKLQGYGSSFKFRLNSLISYFGLSLCVCICVGEREREQDSKVT